MGDKIHIPPLQIWIIEKRDLLDEWWHAKKSPQIHARNYHYMRVKPCPNFYCENGKTSAGLKYETECEDCKGIGQVIDQKEENS
jgi:hypothetical protein